jgi:hypothetical protein
MNFFGLAFDDHARRGPGPARGHQPALAIGGHFDKTDLAGSKRPALFQMTEGWDIDAQLARAIEDGLSGFHFHFPAVNGDFESVHG